MNREELFLVVVAEDAEGEVDGYHYALTVVRQGDRTFRRRYALQCDAERDATLLRAVLGHMGVLAW